MPLFKCARSEESAIHGKTIRATEKIRKGDKVWEASEDESKCKCKRQRRRRM